MKVRRDWPLLSVEMVGVMPRSGRRKCGHAIGEEAMPGEIHFPGGVIGIAPVAVGVGGAEEECEDGGADDGENHEGEDHFEECHGAAARGALGADWCGGDGADSGRHCDIHVTRVEPLRVRVICLRPELGLATGGEAVGEAGSISSAVQQMM